MNLREMYAEMKRLDEEIDQEAQALLDSIPDNLLHDTNSGHLLWLKQGLNDMQVVFSSELEWATRKPSLHIGIAWPDGDYMGAIEIPFEVIEAGQVLAYLQEKEDARVRVQAEKNELKAKAKEEADRQEYARLKEKYENQ